ncbi:c-type cytochrome [Allomesorhizobium camelthorni]
MFGSAGETVFKGCAACHTTDSTNRVGPGLGGVIGRYGIIEIWI